MFYQNGAVAIVRSDSQKIPIACTCRRFYKFVPNVIPKAEGIQNIFPIRTTKDKGFAIGGLPLIDLAV